jgi:hypothetical protein
MTTSSSGKKHFETLLITLSLFLITGCAEKQSKTEGVEDDSPSFSTTSQNATSNREQLPPFDGYDIISCPLGHPKLSLKEWIRKGDGLVIGTIQSIEPPTVGVEPRLGKERPPKDRVKSQCKDIQDAFKVTLKNVSGYFHDQSVPKEITVHFGSKHSPFLNGYATIDNNAVQWHTDPKPALVEGMRIGGLVYKHDLLDLWSFRATVGRPIFAVTSDEGVQFPEIVEKTCGDWPPIQEVNQLSETELLRRVDKLEKEDKLYTASQNREWTNLPGEVVPIKDWLGPCITQDYQDQQQAQNNPQCTTDADCSSGDVCFDGNCVTP